jgi:hypothetical protein
MSARRACCRYTSCDLDKGLVPNKPCQPNANPSGGSFVYLRWRGDENRSMASSMPYGPRETFVILEVEEVRKQGHEVLIVPMHPRACALSAWDCGRWDGEDLKSPRQALDPLLTLVEEEGTLRLVPAGLVLEEYPLRTGNTVLNGWLLGLYGLYDFLLVEESQEIQEAIEANLNALIACLPQYDAGFWSLYDASGALASPFIHRLHIAQLRVLELTFPEHAKAFAKSRATFERQLASCSGRMRTMFLKAYQKLRHPPEVVLR